MNLKHNRKRKLSEKVTVEHDGAWTSISYVANFKTLENGSQRFHP